MLGTVERRETDGSWENALLVENGGRESGSRTSCTGLEHTRWPTFTSDCSSVVVKYMAACLH